MTCVVLYYIFISTDDHSNLYEEWAITTVEDTKVWALSQAQKAECTQPFSPLNPLLVDYAMRLWNNLSQKSHWAHSLSHFPHKPRFIDSPLSYIPGWLVCFFEYLTYLCPFFGFLSRLSLWKLCLLFVCSIQTKTILLTLIIEFKAVEVKVWLGSEIQELLQQNLKTYCFKNLLISFAPFAPPYFIGCY